MQRRERFTHVLFDITVIAKGVDGVLEIAGGALLLLVSPAQFHHIARVLTLHELAEDPHDLVANYILQSTRHLPVGAEVFGAVYLLWHGLVKIGLVAALLLRRRWAYPSAIVAFALFLAYQLYRYSHTHAAALLVLSVLDVVVIVLTWFEYRRLRESESFVR